MSISLPFHHRARSTRWLALLTPLALAACAIGPDYQRPATPLTSAWQSPLPHAGTSRALSDWWQSWNDPVLSQLIDLAQANNPTIQQAAARIQQSRASYVALTSSLFPSLSANASDVRSKGGSQAQFGPGGSNDSMRIQSQTLDAAWELDVVGGARRARAASQWRQSARSADWHDARVSIAAEVAMQYVNLRTCEVLLLGYEVDAKSRAETARLTEQKRVAGFESPANAALAGASRAEAAARLSAQRADCAVLKQVLVELTGGNAQAVQPLLATRVATLPTPTGFVVRSVPADLLSQRPDVASAEAELAAAVSEIGVAMADRFPRISLTGSIGYNETSSPSFNTSGRSWSYGPMLSLPIFDAGRRAANVDLARARADEARAGYQSKVTRAVREVEEALLRLNSASEREADATTALKGYVQFLTAAEARVKVGAGNLSELEEARRAVVLAQGTAVGAARDRLSQWVALYRAVGGGWTSASPPTTPQATTNPVAR